MIRLTNPTWMHAAIAVVFGRLFGTTVLGVSPRAQVAMRLCSIWRVSLGNFEILGFHGKRWTMCAFGKHSGGCDRL